MIRVITLQIIMLSQLLLVGCATKPSLEADFIIRDVSLIDAVNGQRDHMDVVVSQGRIIEVIKHGVETQWRAQRTIAGQGKYLIPGLWDAHVHLSYEPALDQHMFKLLLANGITSVRDTGGELDKVLAWKLASKQTLAPQVYIAGPLIDGKPAVYDGQAKGFPRLALEVDSPEKVVKVVDQLASAGVDLLKAYEMLSPESYRALLERAKHHQLPVTGHVPLSMSAHEVSKLGLNSMEHLRNLEMDCSTEADDFLAKRQRMIKNPDKLHGSKLRGMLHQQQHFPAVASYDEARCAELLTTLSENQTWQVPTLTLMMASSMPYYVEDEWRKTFEYLPEPARSNWLSGTERFKQALKKPSPARAQRVAVADWKMAMIKKMVDANIPIMAGTDMPIFYLTPGFSLHRELQTLVTAGMTPMQALESATLTPARYFGLQDQLGSINRGKTADLVMLSANPLRNIRNITKIEMVIRNGQLLDRAKLDEKLPLRP